MTIRDHYRDYYLSQAGFGGGGSSIYQGTRIQRGYGIGGFFSSLFRSATPMLKQGAKALLRTGMQVASDALAGENLKESAQRRFAQTGRTLASDALEHIKGQVGSGPLVFIRKRKRHTPLKSKSKKRKKSTKKRKTDIFG